MSIKTPTMYYLPAETAEGVRQRAGELGVPASALADLGLRILLSKPAELERWAKAEHERKEVEKRAREEAARVQPVQKSEKEMRAIVQVLQTMSSIWERGRPCWAISFVRICAQSGMLQKQVFPVLYALELEGNMRSMRSEKTDAWGRPKESYWWNDKNVNRSKFPKERPEELPDEGGHLPGYVWCHLGPYVDEEAEGGKGDGMYALELVRGEIKEWTKGQNRATRRVQDQVRELVRAALGLSDQYQKLHFTTAPDYVPEKNEGASISG